MILLEYKLPFRMMKRFMPCLSLRLPFTSNKPETHPSLITKHETTTAKATTTATTTIATTTTTTKATTTAAAATTTTVAASTWATFSEAI